MIMNKSKNYKGIQPIRVFEIDTFREYERIRDSIDSWYPALGLKEVTLDYQVGKLKIRGPKASKYTVYLDETFLSAFWNYCYGLTLSTPLGKTDKGDSLKHSNPYKSLEFCNKLFTDYEDWNIESLPNPEFPKKELEGVIKGVSRIYKIGLYFMIFHEFSHIIRDDVSKSKSSRYENHKMEFASDSYALEVFAKSTNLTEPEVTIGILCAMGLLTFASSFKERFTFTHPYPDDRLVKIMTRFEEHTNIKENNNAWNISTWILFTYDFLRNSIDPGMEGSIFRFEDIREGNTKQLFYKTLARLQDKKIW